MYQRKPHGFSSNDLSRIIRNQAEAFSQRSLEDYVLFVVVILQTMADAVLTPAVSLLFGRYLGAALLAPLRAIMNEISDQLERMKVAIGDEPVKGRTTIT